MKNLIHSRDNVSRGAALMIVLALVVLFTGLALAYFTRTTTDRQLAQSSYTDTSADLLARSGLDIVANDLKQEILNAGTTVNTSNIQPQRSGADASIPNLIRRSIRNDPIPAPGVSSLASSISSTSVSANGRAVSTARWNSHYLLPRFDPTDTSINSTPTSAFVAPDWVLVTRQGPAAAPAAGAVIGRYAFAVYDEGGLLDMSLAGFPSWSGNPNGSCNPAPTPWLTNVQRKGTVGFADLTALGTYAPPQAQVDNIVGWRNYGTSLRTFTNFPINAPGYSGENDCTKQDSYGTYLMYFGEPPFTFDITDQPVPIPFYPFSAVYPATSSSRTDQALMTRQQLLGLQKAICTATGTYTDSNFSQNILQYMGTFSRERNRPAPDWPILQNNLTEGRFSIENLDMVKPNPENCTLHGKGKGQGKSRGRGHLCSTQEDIVNLFGLLWIKSSNLPPDPNGNPQPGHWRYINHIGKNYDHNNPNPAGKILCLKGPKKQNDFFQILHYALNRLGCINGQQVGSLARSFAIGASLIDQFDSDADDLDITLTGNARKWQTHTTVIEYDTNLFAYGMETSDVPYNASGNNPHRPYGAPDPVGNPTILNRAFSNIGEFGYASDTSNPSQPTLNFYQSGSLDTAVLDFFGYNPISSAYPRAGIVNLNTRNSAVLAAIIKGAVSTELPNATVSQSTATNAATAIVSATASQPALTRAEVARLAQAVGTTIGTTKEQKETIARSLAEVGQTRTWNLFIDVIAQTGRYSPDATDINQANKFTVEGEKRYWLHIALCRDLIHTDGTPCLAGDTGCQVDVLGTQLEEVLE
jgi:hypothetical protein